MRIFKHVLAATDFSEASAGAVELAASVARDSGAALTLLHVCEVPLHMEVVPPVDMVTPAVAVAEGRLAALAGTLADRCPDAATVIRLGAPWEQLLACAAETGADLIVLGTHGRRGVAHAVLGSVAERVVQFAPVPVLTVRSPASG